MKTEQHFFLCVLDSGCVFSLSSLCVSTLSSKAFSILTHELCSAVASLLLSGMSGVLSAVRPDTVFGRMLGRWGLLPQPETGN